MAKQDSTTNAIVAELQQLGAQVGLLEEQHRQFMETTHQKLDELQSGQGPSTTGVEKKLEEFQTQVTNTLEKLHAAPEEVQETGQYGQLQAQVTELGAELKGQISELHADISARLAAQAATSTDQDKVEAPFGESPQQAVTQDNLQQTVRQAMHEALEAAKQSDQSQASSPLQAGEEESALTPASGQQAAIDAMREVQNNMQQLAQQQQAAVQGPQGPQTVQSPPSGTPHS